MIAGEHTFDDIDTAFSTNLPDDLPHAQTHISEQDLLAILGSQYQVIEMVKDAVFAFLILPMMAGQLFLPIYCLATILA